MRVIHGWINAAAYCGASVATLRRRVAEGRVKAEKVDGVWQFNPQDLDTPIPRRQSRKKGSQACCYFMLKMSNPPIIKIGWTENAKSRMKTLSASESCPYPLILVAVIPGAISEEAKFHKMFSKHKVGKEWFKADPILDWLLAFGFVNKITFIRCVNEIMEGSDVGIAETIFRTSIQYSSQLKVNKTKPECHSYPGKCCPLPRTWREEP